MEYGENKISFESVQKKIMSASKSLEPDYSLTFFSEYDHIRNHLDQFHGEIPRMKTIPNKHIVGILHELLYTLDFGTSKPCRNS